MQRPARFFSFNKPSDWEAGSSANLTVREDGVTVSRTEKYSLYRIVHAADIDGADAVADFAVGPGSKLYVLDARASLWVHDYENRHSEPLYSPGHRLFSHRALLASRGDALYIADPVGERRVFSVSPSNGQLLWAAQEWNGLELFPLATAADAGRNLYTVVPLDCEVGPLGHPEVPQGGRIVILQWSPSGEVTQLYEHDSLRLEQPCAVHALRGRFYVTAAEPGSPVLLDAATGTTIAFRPDGAARAAFGLAPEAGKPAGLSTGGGGVLYIGDSSPGNARDERFILQYTMQGELTAKVSGYRERADKLLHDDRGRMYVLDAEQGAIALLELQSRVNASAETGLPEGWYWSGELDSAEDETEWHKIELLADIPEETQLRVSYFATDETFGVLGGRVVDYSDYFADPDVPNERKWRESAHLWSEPIVNPKDALLPNAKGRYLRLRIEWVGSDRTAPTIRRMRVFFPRQSPIVHLPSIYQEDPDGTRFLERFLALFGSFLAEMEEKIDKVSSNFDADAVAGRYLSWLGGWLALDVADGWEEHKLRTLLKRAPELYKLRGTRQGLARMLHLYTGVEPYIVEHHQLKTMQETSELRLMFQRLYGDDPYTFCVMLPPECVRTDKQRLMVERIIEDQKPAYAEGKLVVLQPWMHADMHTYLGINTVLSEPTLLTLDEQSSMPHHTVLIDVDRDKRIDIHTRLELDSELE
ncbi:phage tail protein [Paenibacillus flagellatus]|uniref:Phage tail protein n=1 Tax=Paenibacillus flagellatus TaxID=2211139 RepID=A0A2V5K772_9BACL|nr:phage tail protein [Paenibacillus flagellatus]PYI55178.1 phage tail protein [Paenibacillus flagellatus]